MRVKHLDELYTWKQIRKLQLIHRNNLHNGFVPIAIYAPSGGYETHYGWSDHYEWYGRRTTYFARRLWESARRELEGIEAEALAFDVVEGSECFNTIRFKNPSMMRDYCAEFKRLLKRIADRGEVKCAIGRAPARPHPWDKAERLEEIIIADDAEYKPFVSHRPEFDNTIPEYRETEALGWAAVEGYFVELTEDELAFLNGEKFINKSPTALDRDLLDACKELNVANVKSALEAGANPNSTEGGASPDVMIETVLDAVCDFYDSAAAICKAYEIIDLLIASGGDLDFCPYDACTPLYAASYRKTSLVKFLIERGANPNAVSWIALGETPSTPLDSIADDINAYGSDADLDERFDVVEKAGGKYFSELVPDFFYEDG